MKCILLGDDFIQIVQKSKISRSNDERRSVKWFSQVKRDQVCIYKAAIEGIAFSKYIRKHIFTQRCQIN